jgi:hypothetical protein
MAGIGPAQRSAPEANPAGQAGPVSPAGASAASLTETAARALPGWGMAGAVVLLLVIGIAVLSTGVGSSTPAEQGIGVVLIAISLVLLRGLVPVAPGQARVLLLFGRYIGTIRTSGLHWVNPLADRVRLSTRIRNHETPVAKVNDAIGNPIEIAAVVVWQVRDTAKASFGVDNLTGFVATQTETAVRHVATSYPYDAHGEGQMSLRENATEITGELTAEIAARVAPAGVTVLESRLTRLSYAAEIAQAMLRRQQAEAVIAARQRIVDGALGMVEMALSRLANDGLVDLDEERKAAMISNLLVVLCSEQATQPIVNTGTLYQ